MHGSTPKPMSPEWVQIESLKDQVASLQARVAVTEDLESQVAQLQEQLALLQSAYKEQ